MNLEVGPDGALYVVDMYRAVIEHPDWMPDELKNRPDLMLGNDRGRIYRVTSTTTPAPRTVHVDLSGASTQDLVAVFADTNAWRRDTAARLILERQDKSIGDALGGRALGRDYPSESIHALSLLAGLGLAKAEALSTSMTDGNPRGVEQAILAAEPLAAGDERLRKRIAQLANHDDARVRFTALLVAGELPANFRLPVDEWERDALLIAAGRRGGDALAAVLQHQGLADMDPAAAEQLIAALARLAAAAQDKRQTVAAIDALVANPRFGAAGLSSFLAQAVRRQFDTGDSLAAR